MGQILIVDDNPKNIQLLGNILTEKGYDVEYAINGREAFEVAEEEDFDLILMDVMMPEMDGYEACRKIKQLEDKIDIPIIFITAKTDIDSIQTGFKSGGVDYITKPFNAVELLARVDTHVTLKQSKEKLKTVNRQLEDKVRERTQELEDSNNRLRLVNNELEVLDTAKRDFLQIISHEIRTPLNVILGMTDLIKDVSDDMLGGEIVEALDNSCQRLEKFSMTALDISYLKTQEKKSIEREPVEVGIMLEEIVIALQMDLDKKNLTIETSIENKTIHVDRVYFNKCIQILILNAIKHTSNNSTIRVNGALIGDRYQITIQDEGNGFPEALIQKELKSFNATSYFDQNPGLDLYLCKLIVEVFGGDFSIENNNGAVVKIILE